MRKIIHTHKKRENRITKKTYERSGFGLDRNSLFAAARVLRGEDFLLLSDRRGEG
jgi:hypothetical protein